MTIKERVKKGVALLDKNLKGWRYCINLDNFDMSDFQTCVLGQIGGGSYGKGSYLAFQGNLTVDDEESHGFEHWCYIEEEEDAEEFRHRTQYEYDALEKEWLTHL